MIRVILFEDNSDFADSVSELLSDADGMELIGVYGNCKNVVKNVLYHQPDVVLMDIDMPIENGLQGLRSLRTAGNEVHILMLTVFDDNDRVFQSVCFGASGYILKRAAIEEVFAALDDLVAGGSPMSGVIARKVVESFGKKDSCEATQPKE